MTRTRVGRIPYLNSEVFYWTLDPAAHELVSLVPRELSRAARDGRVDAGPVPLVACFELEDRFEPLGSLGIATVEKAASVFLYARRPVEDLGGARIAITTETTTSVRLLETLLTQRFGVRPGVFTGPDEPGDAALVIGDAALRARHGLPGYPHQYDLGEEWHRWTGLPFVFALWIVRRDLAPDVKARLAAALRASVARGLADADAIAARRPDLGMEPAEVVAYIRSFRYVLGDAEREAVLRFRGCLAEGRA